MKHFKQVFSLASFDTTTKMKKQGKDIWKELDFNS